MRPSWKCCQVGNKDSKITVIKGGQIEGEKLLARRDLEDTRWK
jgi:hypothetical protein